MTPKGGGSALTHDSWAALEELTAQEAQRRFTSGSPVVFPIGSLEAHGPYLPLGTDSLVACAFAQQLAEKTGGILTPCVPYGYAPTTANLPSTISIPARLLQDYLASICRSMVRQGCRRIVFLNIHKENSPSLIILVHELYAELGVHLLYVNPYTCFADDLDRDFWQGHDNSYKEAALFLAACEVLGRPALADLVRAAPSETASRPVLLERLRGVGAIGFRYRSEREHIAPRQGVSLELGQKYLDLVTDRLAAVLAEYAAYTDQEA